MTFGVVDLVKNYNLYTLDIFQLAENIVTSQVQEIRNYFFLLWATLFTHLQNLNYNFGITAFEISVNLITFIVYLRGGGRQTQKCL